MIIKDEIRNSAYKLESVSVIAIAKSSGSCNHDGQKGRR